MQWSVCNTPSKNPHTLYMVSKNLSVCLSVVNFDPNYPKTGKTEWAKKIMTSMAKTHVSKKNLSMKWPVGPKEQHFDPIYIFNSSTPELSLTLATSNFYQEQIKSLIQKSLIHSRTDDNNLGTLVVVVQYFPFPLHILLLKEKMLIFYNNCLKPITKS